jgi:signal transduction histidine kinase
MSEADTPPPDMVPPGRVSAKEAARTPGGDDEVRLGRGLSSKLLFLTILFVMIAEVLIFVPSVSNMRLRWLSDKLATAASASIVVEGFDEMDLPQPVQTDTLMSTGTKAIALRRAGSSRLIASTQMPPTVDMQYDLSDVGPLTAIGDAIGTLVHGSDRIIRVFGPVAGDPGTMIEIVMEERPLKTAMLVYARNVLILSLVISLITAGLVFLAINALLIRPIRRMTSNMQAFAEAPDEPARVIRPSTRDDELGQAERHLASMQQELQHTLKEQKNLADLGLAVSKINHDMRNILASAQLISDRLAGVDDPIVQRFAPKLLRTIDRAVSYSNEVLAYGRAREATPKRRWLDLKRLIEDVRDITAVDPAFEIDFVIDMPDGLEVEADSEQLFRVIHNLSRNSVEALKSLEGDAALVKRIRVAARREGSVVTIMVEDTGPGMPAGARANLFKAFRGSTRPGGTGLGLTIARELVLAHGGDLKLVESNGPGTIFAIVLPDQPLPIAAFRNRPKHRLDQDRQQIP